MDGLDRAIENEIKVTFYKGGKGQQQSKYQPQIMSNTLRSRAVVRILELLSEGPVRGLHESSPGYYGTAIELDETALQSTNGTFNFTIKEHYFRAGLPDDDVIPGFPASEAEFGVSGQLLYGVPIIRTISNPNASLVRIKVRVTGLFTQMENGDVLGSRVTFAADVRHNGGPWILYGYWEIAGKTMSAYEMSVLLPLNPIPGGTIDIKVYRVTDPPLNQSINNDSYFSSYTEIEDGRIQYADSCMVGTVIDAEQFPNVPKRGYLLDGLEIQIPSNYDPDERTYTGDWDGTFITEWTNNPAWVLYALLTNPRWGMGQDLPAEFVNKWSFYESSQYNDELVDDLEGGLEQRYTFNWSFLTQEDAFKIMNSVASNMAASLYWGNGQIHLVQDRPQLEPTRLFAPADIVDGIFDYNSTDYRSYYSVANVTYVDTSNHYKSRVEAVIDPDLISQYGYRQVPEATYGVTSRGQAIRQGRKRLYESQYETEVVGFKLTLENVTLRPGEMFYISDPSRAGARFGGRIAEAIDVDKLRLDKLPVEVTSTGWTLYLQIDDTIIACPVIDVQLGDIVTVTSRPAEIEKGTMWMMASSLVNPTQWVCVGISEQSENFQFPVLARQYSHGKFAYMEGAPRVPDPPFSLFPTGPLVGVHDINYREYIYFDTRGTPQSGFVLSWAVSPDPRVMFYVVELNGPGDDHRILTGIGTVSIDVTNARGGIWEARVTAVDALGRRSPIELRTFVTIGLTEKPLPPSKLFLNFNDRGSTISWVPTGEIDVRYWWVKWSPDLSGATWNSATTVEDRIAREQTSLSVPARQGTYFIKAIDSLGQESVDARSSIAQFEQSFQGNIVSTIVEEPTFLGIRGLWRLVGSELVLDPPTTTEGIDADIIPAIRSSLNNATATRARAYYFTTEFNMGIAGMCGVVVDLSGFGDLGTDFMANWNPLSVAEPLERDRSGAWDAWVEMRISTDGFTFGQWQRVQQATVLARRLQFRLIGAIYDLLTFVTIIRAGVTIDVPDRLERGDNQALPGGVATITFATPFWDIPHVDILSRENMALGGSINLRSKSKYGFVVAAYDKDGVSSSVGAFDWIATGYGVST